MGWAETDKGRADFAKTNQGFLQDFIPRISNANCTVAKSLQKG
jgi:hypothetical protein